VADTQFANLAKKQENKLVKLLTDMEMLITGKTTFKEEFVTAGGVSLQEIDCQTMQSKLLPHLYFAGEIMDVDGVTGGFNFQHAWASGYIAAKAMTTLVSPGDRTEA
jgi:predicted flavoprotein YhiN